MDYSIKIGGEAGQGIQTVGDTLAKVFTRSGYHVFTHQDYESRIRGGHNFYQIRLADNPVTASRDGIDIVVAFDKDSILLHENELTENGLIIYDSKSLKEKRDKGNYLDVPFVDLAFEHGGNKIMANTVATGAVLGMLKIELNILFDIIKDTFMKKGDDVIKGNINAAAAGHEFALKNCHRCSFAVEALHAAPLLLMTGAEAIALGAIASGLKFYSAYPMTPSTGIMNYIADKEAEYGIIVEQSEDEIAAINMALGASFAGVRAMTGTSGGGFALMVEGLSLAGMTETPVVIALGQRPGPATGFPTRTEQGDLQFALYTAHGEFPRVIFAPGTPEQAFYLTNRAFDIAEKYQIPVIIIFDQYLADSQWTYDGFDLTKIKYADYRLRGDVFKNLPEYKRHAFTQTGVTPLGIPGDAKHLMVTDSDEHDEEGHIVEDAETRIKMLDKRLFKKIPLIRQEIGPPVFYGKEEPEIVIAGWGSTCGVMKEAVDVLLQNPPAPPFYKGELISPSLEKRGEGRFSYKTIAMLHFSELYPFPSIDKFNYLRILNNAKITICIENNATGQFARLMRAETGFDFNHRINKYDGRPFTVNELLKEIYSRLAQT
ncbi:MAG: 2-oxoacid:acceptor oxidoreductase subunit alpha [Nitrospirae bacterium]|nr:2-oxoacid:acceptor oxidoreductase subunit alpha [Nitrospirota bacterium]MBI4847246.1 2-oxoacid:acceptor oxidoreductase subunit alpha [Nitrospirota bacterium]